MHILGHTYVIDHAPSSIGAQVLKVHFEKTWLHGFDEHDIIPIVKNLFGRRAGITEHAIALDTSIKKHYYKHLHLPIQETSLDACDVILIPVFHGDAYQPGDVKIQHFSRICKQAEQLSKSSGKPVMVHLNTKDTIDPRLLPPDQCLSGHAGTPQPAKWVCTLTGVALGTRNRQAIVGTLVVPFRE